jgi:hypothetical protein
LFDIVFFQWVEKGSNSCNMSWKYVAFS